jgi:hypothetical protein
MSAYEEAAVSQQVISSSKMSRQKYRFQELKGRHVIQSRVLSPDLEPRQLQHLVPEIELI